MRKVTMEEFIEAIKNMKHVGFASPMPYHGYTDTREYWEGNGLKAECRVEANKREEYWLGEMDPAEEN